MKIVVTGGRGFLGRHLLPQLKIQYPQGEIVGYLPKIMT